MNQFRKFGLPLLAIVLGVVALIVGIRQNSTKLLYDSTVKATIVDIEESWETDPDPDVDTERLVKTAYIDYAVNGTKYEHVLCPVQDDNAKVGDTVEILYQSSNPEKISAPNISTTAVVFIIVGAVVAVGGLLGLVFVFIKRR